MRHMINPNANTKRKMTEIVMVLDKSGSMHLLRDEVIGGYNGFVEDQQAVEGEATLTLVLFDSSYKVIYENLDIAEVPVMDKSVYKVGGGTALYDTLCDVIDMTCKRLKAVDGVRRPKMIFVINTDGADLDSKRFDSSDVKSRVEDARKNFDCEFVFLGANIDAFTAGGNLGVNPAMTQQFSADSAGVTRSYAFTADNVTAYRNAD